MLRAQNSKGEYVYIEDANKEEEYICPFCGTEVKPRQGKVNAWTFAHLKNDGCYEYDYENDMSNWHIWWQEQFPTDYREIIINNNYGFKRRADVSLENVVIEFQHSPMTSEEFINRNRFYTSCGYKVIWLFDATDADIELIKTSDYDSLIYKWRYAPKTLNFFDPTVSRNVKVFIETEVDHIPEDQENFDLYIEGAIESKYETEIISIDWKPNDSLKYFASNNIYDAGGFIQYIYEYSKKNKKIIYKDEMKSILDFFEIYKSMNKGIFLNKKTLQTVKVYRKSFIKYKMYNNKLYGYPLNPIVNTFEESTLIKDASKKEWILQRIIV